jgi:site-specific DNA recombinase
MKVAIYCRISRDTRDPEKEQGLGVDRQEYDCLTKIIQPRGWDHVASFVDNDISASTLSRKRRPEYERLLTAARNGEFDAIVAYSNSRLTRRPSEWVDLINLANASRLQIATVVSGSHDLETADGRAVAMTIAIWDAAEAERTSERLIRQKAQRASEGKPQGGRHRVYGYDRRFEVIEAEAEVVREIFTRRAGGQSLTSIARHLNEFGLFTVAGKAWSAANLGKLVAKPGYCGLHSYKGSIIGATSYQAIIDETLWRQATSEHIRTSPGTNARRWLLSGIATCGKCHTTMVGNAAIDAYRCHKVYGGCGGIRVRSDWLESPIVSLVMAREATYSRAPERSEEPQVDLGLIDAEIEAVRAAYGRGDLVLEDMTPLLAGLRRRRRDAVVVLAATAPAPISGHLATWTDWLRMDLSQRRALVGRHIGSVVVGPRQTTGPGRFEPERLTVRWRDGTIQHVNQATLDGAPYYDVKAGRFRSVRIPIRIRRRV